MSLEVIVGTVVVLVAAYFIVAISLILFITFRAVITAMISFLIWIVQGIKT